MGQGEGGRSPRLGPLPQALASPDRRCYIAAMNAEREIFDRPDEDAADAVADAEADADVAAGRTVDHAEVARWLAKWGTPEETPAPAEWLK